LTKAYFAYMEVLFGNHISFILTLDTNTFMHIIASLESGLKGLDAGISSQKRRRKSSACPRPRFAVARGSPAPVAACTRARRRNVSLREEKDRGDVFNDLKVQILASQVSIYLTFIYIFVGLMN
ncbi:hypothetical protein B296_00021744, partial [Ensete ventricosum]